MFSGQFRYQGFGLMYAGLGLMYTRVTFAYICAVQRF